jgi:hypothetical protein
MPKVIVKVKSKQSESSAEKGKKFEERLGKAASNFIPKKKSSFWDDDEDAAPPTKPVSKPEPAKPVAKPVEIKRVRELTAPEAYFNIQVAGGSRILIIDRLGKDWKDLLCYNYDMGVTMHLKVEDLIPSHEVQNAINFLTELRQ